MGGKPGGGRNAQALDHAIRKDRERLSGRRRKQEDEPDEAPVWCRADAHLLGPPAGILRPGQNLRVNRMAAMPANGATPSIDLKE